MRSSLHVHFPTGHHWYLIDSCYMHTLSRPIRAAFLLAKYRRRGAYKSAQGTWQESKTNDLRESIYSAFWMKRKLFNTVEFFLGLYFDQKCSDICRNCVQSVIRVFKFARFITFFLAKSFLRFSTEDLTLNKLSTCGNIHLSTAESVRCISIGVVWIIG